jgi:type I restriction enzyme M protein
LVASRKKGVAAEAEIAAGRTAQQAVLRVLQDLDAETLYKNRDAFTHDLKAAARARGVKLAAPVFKAILSALSERDETAEVCTVRGRPEPDTELRDYENVPLTEEIGAYMEREVLPHVADAWVDHSKTKVGYEIPFTRHFYVYQPPRSLETIEAEIRELERKIQGMLGRALG